MNKKLEGDRAIEEQVNKLTVARYMDCACFNLRKTARAVTQLYDEALRPSGLRCTQFSLLIAATRLEPVTVTHLAEIAVMDRTTLARNLRPLEKEGLMNVTPGNDQRTRIVTVTRRGKEVLLKAFPLWEKAQARVVKGLGLERWKSLQANLEEVVSQAIER
ncbi:MAG TPA: MarR family winged helix-turn-helix transcriptional regulator [Nitrospirota bacterium]|nr:MarR family winged helix-turn-helix transcriptional regulator [Nitrospirota bacterium]